MHHRIQDGFLIVPTLGGVVEEVAGMLHAAGVQEAALNKMLEKTVGVIDAANGEEKTRLVDTEREGRRVLEWAQKDGRKLVREYFRSGIVPLAIRGQLNVMKRTLAVHTVEFEKARKDLSDSQRRVEILRQENSELRVAGVKRSVVAKPQIDAQYYIKEVMKANLARDSDESRKMVKEAKVAWRMSKLLNDEVSGPDAQQTTREGSNHLPPKKPSASRRPHRVSRSRSAAKPPTTTAPGLTNFSKPRPRSISPAKIRHLSPASLRRVRTITPPKWKN